MFSKFRSSTGDTLKSAAFFCSSDFSIDLSVASASTASTEIDIESSLGCCYITLTKFGRPSGITFFFTFLVTILLTTFFFFPTPGGGSRCSVGGVDNCGFSPELGVLTNFVFGLLALESGLLISVYVEFAVLLKRIDSSKLSDFNFFPLLRCEFFIFFESLKLFEFPLSTDVLVFAESALTRDDFFIEVGFPFLRFPF